VPLRRREAQSPAATERLPLADGHDLGAESAQFLLEQRFGPLRACNDHTRHAGVGEPRDLVCGERSATNVHERFWQTLRRVAEPFGLAPREDQGFHYAVSCSGSRSAVSGKTSSGDTARPMPS